VGKITKNKTKNSVHYEVRSLKELTKVVITHFDKYPLITQKRGDYELFKLAVNKMNNKEHLTLEGIQQIVNIKSSMNKNYLSDSLIITFPNISPVLRPLVTQYPESLYLN
jgi:hypothetical protein